MEGLTLGREMSWDEETYVQLLVGTCHNSLLFLVPSVNERT